mgnify:CR=1 FL=1
MNFFVNDILDMAVLQNRTSNFAKDLKKFEIRETIQEIIDILQGKINLKNLQIVKVFENFEGD